MTVSLISLKYYMFKKKLFGRVYVKEKSEKLSVTMSKVCNKVWHEFSNICIHWVQLQNYKTVRKNSFKTKFDKQIER